MGAKAMARVKTMSDAQAKALLLKIIDALPDAGLRALEWVPLHSRPIGL